MKPILFLWICLSFYISSNAQKASTHSDVNTNNTVTNAFSPQLTCPSDKSILFIPNPVFIWMPPPTSGGAPIIYSIRMVEVQDGQTPQQALLQNPPLLNTTGLTNTFLTYPIDAPSLQNNTKYAWQVGASSTGKSFGQADVKTFTFQKPENEQVSNNNVTNPKSKQKPDSNIQQKQTNKQTANIAQKPNNKSNTDFQVFPVASVVSDGHFYVTKGIIRFAYINKANDKKLTYIIKQLDKNENLTSLPEIAVSPGANKLAINLQHNAEMEQNKYYDLEITDGKGQVYKLMYYYINQ